MSRIRGTRAGLLLTVATAFVGCSGGGGTAAPPDGGSENASCYPFELGTTCTLALDPNGMKEASFIGPGTGPSFVTISLTGSTTEASWVLINTAARSPEGQCNDPTDGKDHTCVAYVVGGAPYLLQVHELQGKSGTTNLTIYASTNVPSLGSAGKPLRGIL